MRSLSCLWQFVRRVSYVQGQSLSPNTREYFYYIDHQGQLFLDDTKVKNFITCFKDKKFLEFFFKRVKMNTSGRYETEFPYLSPCGRETNYIHCDDLPIVFSQLLNEDGKIIEDITECGNYSSSPSHTMKLHENHPSPHESNNNQKSSLYTTTSNTVPADISQVRKSATDSIRTSTGSSQHNMILCEPSAITVPGHQAPPSTKLSLSYGGTLTLTVPFQPSSLCMLPTSGRVYHMGPDRLGGVGLIKSSLAIELSRFFVYEEGACDRDHPVWFRWQGRMWKPDTTLINRLSQVIN